MKDNCKALRLKQDTTVSMVKEYGIEVLSNEHLLAAVLGIDAQNHGYQEVLEILDHTHSLRRASLKTFNDLVSIDGIGEKKATAILATFELAKRLNKEKSDVLEDLGNSISIYAHMKPFLQDLDHEEMWVLCMNQHFRLIKKQRISIGGITQTAFDIRVMMKVAVQCNATIIALCHNHPSNSSTPSKMDDILTQKFAKACEVMNLFFMDHIIYADNGFYSYYDKGKL